MANLTTIYLNSKDLSSGVISNFIYNLPQGIVNNAAYYVKNVSIPFTQFVTIYKNMSGSSNVNLAISDTNGIHNATLSAGNYNATSLANALQTAMNAATTLTNPYTVTYNQNNYTFTIASNAGDFLVYWATTLQYPSQNLALNMGFSSSATLTGATSYTSQLSSQLSGTSLNYYVKSGTLTLDGSYSYFQNVKDTVIATVPINQVTGGYLEYQNNNPNFIPLLSSNIYSLDIQLVDDYNLPVDLNGCNWTISLVFANSY